MKSLKIVLITMLLSLSTYAQQAHNHTDESLYVKPTDKQVLAKLNAWQDNKFGLIIHWGVYSQAGIIESWSLCPEDADFIKRTGPAGNNWCEYKKWYENLYTSFNPIMFNPDSWAQLAKQAGMKYVVFTTKHHDGFSMFDTKYSEYKITNAKCPFSTNPKSNIALEVFNAFRKQDFMIGAYFSKPDWHSNDYWWSYFPPKDRNPSYDTSKYPERWANFKKFATNQIEELMTGYGKIDLLWLDGGQVRPPKQDIEMSKIATMARTHQPGLIVVDRTVPGANENYITPEQQIPDRFISAPWETCLTIGDSWSYVPNDNYKTTRNIVHTLCDVVAKGGNLLLNVGPKSTGELDETQATCLKEIGDWMNVNGEAIYGTRPIAPYRESNIAYTSKCNTVYAICLLPENKGVDFTEIALHGFVPKKNSVITVLDTKINLKWSLKDNKLIIKIPKNLAQNLATNYTMTFKIEVEKKKNS